MPRAYTLSSALVAANAGGPVVALAADAVGRSFRAYKSRPGPERNRSGRRVLAELRGQLPGGVIRAEPEEPQADVLLVTAEGPLEQRAGQHEPSGSYIDGHDAFYERLAAAFEVGDVVLCIDGPGGAVAGGPEMMRRAAEMKAKHGRRCIGHTEGGCHSMHFWWMAAICDEFYVSPDGKAGSIGVRGMLASVAGALAKDGIAVEVLEDPDGKAAGVPELPISEEARARAQHEVTLAADMFRAAVASSAIGMRSGLTPDALKAMRGRSFTGAEAVEAGLADGVATLEDVMAYALATAGGGEGTMHLRGEGDDKPKNDEEKPGEGKAKAEDEPGEEKQKAKTCARCGDALNDKRFCGLCGEDSVPPAKDEEDGEEPPGSMREPHNKDDGKKARAAIVPPAARQASTVAGMLGLPPKSSQPALLAALASALRVRDHAAQITGYTSDAEIVGGLSALAEDVASAVQVRRDLEAAQAAEMVSLALRAASLDGSRDGWVVDVVKGDARNGVALGPKAKGYSRDELKAYVEGREKNAAPKRTPWDASQEKATAATDAAKAEAGASTKAKPTQAQIDAAKKHPAVTAAYHRSGNTKTLDELAAAHAAAFPQIGA